MTFDNLRSYAESVANPVPVAEELRSKADSVQDEYPEIARGLRQLAGDESVQDERKEELTGAQLPLLKILEDKHDIMTADDWAFHAENEYTAKIEDHPKLRDADWVRSALESLVEDGYVACSAGRQGKSFSAYEKWAIDEQRLRDNHDLLFSPSSWRIDDIRRVEELTGMSPAQIVRGIGKHPMKEFDF